MTRPSTSLSRREESKDVDHRDKRGDDGCYADASVCTRNDAHTCAAAKFSTFT